MQAIIKALLELAAYLILAVIAAALIGAFGAGLGQLVGLADPAADAMGWGACLTAFVFLAVTGRPIDS